MDHSDVKQKFSIFIIIFVILMASSTGILMWLQRNEQVTALEDMKAKEQWAVQMESTLISTNVAPLISDIDYLHDVYGPELANPENYDKIAHDWVIFSNKRQIYDQIRFIDVDGNERVRIDFKLDGGAIRVPDKELQNKKDRYYFYEATELPNEAISISPLDLNIEHNAIEIPYKPMIRMGMPIYKTDGHLLGVLVVNYLANDMLDLFKRYESTTAGSIMLLNDKSYYLSSPENSKEWGFMFPEKQAVNFANDHPDEWERIQNGSATIITENGLFTALPIRPYSMTLEKFTGPTVPRTIYSNDVWYIVSWIPKTSANSFLYTDDIGHLFLSVATQATFLILLLLILTISWIATSAVLHYQGINFRADYDPLTHAYSRQGGMYRLRSLFQTTRVSRLNLSICFIDINGLKEINDQLGHNYGDEMIKTAVNIIQSEIRNNDFLIRVGGDEFILVLAYVNSQQSETIWQRVKERMDLINENEDRPYLISLSHGIVDNQLDSSVSLDELISQADQKMYAEKQIIKKSFSSIRK